MQLTHRPLLSWALTMAMTLGCSPGRADDLSPYSTFQAMTVSELAQLQVKLTIVGDQPRLIQTMMWRANGHVPNLGVFEPYYRSGFDGAYSADYLPFISFGASTTMLKAMIDSIAALPTVTDGGVDSSGALSFSMSNIVDDTTRVFESILDPSSTKQLFGELLEAFAANDSAIALLTERACFLGMMPDPRPVDVTSMVSIEVRGFRKDRTTGHYVARARVTNTSGSTITGPLMLMVFAPLNVEDVGHSGTTCAIRPSGAPFYELASGGNLGPGQHADVTLRFVNPDDEVLDLENRRVYAGPGYR